VYETHTYPQSLPDDGDKMCHDDVT
jgi:hypothetical protein